MNTANTGNTANIRDAGDAGDAGNIGNPDGPGPSAPLSVGGLGTGVGSLPHTDAAEASRIVFGEVPDFPFLPELPGRGPHADIIGRGVALLAGIDADLTTTGWRIGAGRGREQLFAAQTLAADLDAFEAVATSGVGADAEAVRLVSKMIKTQVVGPLTLASALELPGGGSVVADPGAIRDVAQSLAEGVRSHLGELARRLGVFVVLQVDEPGLPAVLTGRIRRPSGLGRYPALPTEQATVLLDQVLRAASPDGGPSGGTDGDERPVRTVVHCCADTVPVELLLHAGADAIGFDPSGVPASGVDEFAMAVESGATLFVGAIPPVRPEGGATGTAATSVGQPRSPASRILDWWRRLGFDEELAARRIVVTTACGSAGADEEWAVAALGTARDTARQLAS